MSDRDMSDFSMMDLFRMETETQVVILNENILALENNPNSPVELESLMRAAHSLKGAARIVGLDAAVQITHVMEDCFVAAQSGAIALDSPDKIDVILGAIDLLSRLSQIPATEIENWLSTHQSEIDNLETLILAIINNKTEAKPTTNDDNVEIEVIPDLPLSNTNETWEDRQIKTDLSMLSLFVEEVESQSLLLQENLLLLKNNLNLDLDLESLVKSAHLIQSAAKILHFHQIIKLALAIENTLLAVAKYKASLNEIQVESLLAGVNIFITLMKIPARQVEDWLIKIEPEIDNIVNIINLISQSAMPTLVPSKASRKKTNVKTTASQPPKTTKQSTDLPDAKPASNSGEPTLDLQQHSPEKIRGKSENLKFKNKENQPKKSDRTIRVNAENLNKIMGLASESLVETKWLQPFGDSLSILRKHQNKLYSLLEKLQDSLSDTVLDRRSEDYLSSARKAANECSHVLSDRINELEFFSRRYANLSERLYREVIASNMRPFADGIQGFPRMLRDLARQLSKQVKFEVVGKSTQVDRDILEKLEAPLTHILRNALDHGIEPPEARLAAGKSPQGTIRLEASHRGGMLSIVVSDDGRGIELDKLREKIVSKEMVSAEMAAKLTESELMDFLFLPGFSTASQVTEISGRGVGLDIVQSMVQEVGGILRAVSQPEKGMSFYLQLPLTLSVIRTLLVEISGEPYAFPLTRIDRLVLVETSEIAIAENRQYFTLDDENIGLVNAYQVLELAAPNRKLDLLPVIIVSARSNSYGLAVDKILGERDLVVRPLDPRLGKIPDISAAAFMEDGSPVLIIDVEYLVRSTDRLLARTSLKKVSETTQTDDSKIAKRLLIVEDSITVREFERKILENQGYKVDIAVNGIDGWNALRSAQYDLVISDVDMPGMTGIELVSQIKNHATLNSIPVIIVSYKDRQEDRLRGLSVGADYYLTKSSFHDDTLLNAVVDLIGEP
ncbi:MAG: response regulator [Microcoleus sp.]